MQQSIEIVRRRIDETGVVDPQITQQGDDRIVVQLPGISDPNRIKELLGKTAHMTFQLVDETANPSAGAPPPPGVDYLPMQDNPSQKIAVRRRIDVDGGDLTDARAGTNPQTGEWVVNFTFNSIGARRFADVTRANVNHRFAIVLDGKVISAPVIREPITGGRGQISGTFTAASANDLAVLLRAGALPAPLTVVEERSVGPELGADSIRAGAISLAVGFVLVIAFMAIFYGLFGWFANVCLVVNLVLMLGIMSLLQATLTLPGMAGILLTLGMAVDANILINERIREEQRLGPPAAVGAGARLHKGLQYDLRFQRRGVPGPRDAVRLRLRAGAGIRRDHHRRHRHLDVHRLDADAPAGLALVYRHAPAASAGLIAMFIRPAFRLVPDNTKIAVHARPDHGPRRLGRCCRRRRWCCSSIRG